MNPSRDRRLAKLERAHKKQEPRRKPRIIYAWRDAPLESAKQTIARRCPKGVPAGTRLAICSWQAEGERRQPEHSAGSS